MINSYIESTTAQLKVYKRRWYILLLYVLYTALGQCQWTEYTIITNIVMRYYNVTSSTVEWTAMVFMAVYPVLVIPASYVIDKMGMRVAGLIGCLGTAIGLYIKLFSVQPNLFYLVIVGQTIVGMSQLVVLALPPKLAVTWFGEKEVSRACSLGVFGMQVGCAIGFILPSTIVKNHDNLEDVERDLKTMCWILAIAITPIVIAMLIYFPRQPKLPSNTIRDNDEEFTISGFFHSLKGLCQNCAFLLHMAACSISIGVYTVIGSLLNLFVLQYFENAQDDAGRMGLGMVVAGIVGTPVVGFILDKTHKFKESCFISLVLQAISIGLLIFALEMRIKVLVYICFIILGLFLNTYIPAAIEFATELTYPSTESTTTGILFAMSQVLGFVSTLILSNITNKFGTFWALLILIVSLVLGAILTLFTPNRLHRQASFKKDLKGFKSVPQDDIIKS